MSIVTNTALRKVLSGAVDSITEQLRHLRGRNLLLGTQSTQISNANYEMAEFQLAEAPSDGETFTISMDAKLGSDRTQFYFYNSGGNVPLASCKVVDGRVEATFKWVSRNASGTTADNTSVRVYQYPRTGTSASIISHVKLERGNIATEWCRADEDINESQNSAIKECKEYCDTSIDGVYEFCDESLAEQSTKINEALLMKLYPYMVVPFFGWATQSITTLPTDAVVESIAGIAMGDDDQLIFTVMVRYANGSLSGTYVEYFPGAELFGIKAGNMIYPGQGKVYIDAKNGNIYCCKTDGVLTKIV